VIGFLLAVLLVVLVALMAIRNIRAARLRRVTLRPEALERMRRELLAYVESQGDGVVDLDPFYARRQQLKDGDRYAVQHPLYHEDILRPADRGNPFANWLLVPVGRHVVLNRGERNPW
jgi:hypothetical protein